MQWIVILIAVDVILGIIASFIKKEFAFSKLGNFMKGLILTYVLGFAVIELVGEALPKLALIVPVAFVLIVITLVASIIGNLGRWGIPLPKCLKK